MTNISPDITMEKLQKIAHGHTFIMMFKSKCDDKKYWQKLWLINRYAEELEFKRSDLS